MTETTLPSQYDPSKTEAKWQQFWDDQKVFEAHPEQGGKPFCIVIPPPNVTGNLHMGHAFNTALIDVLVRYHRMRGDNTLCLPGTDHASIAVQAIIDKQLQAEGLTRFDIGREKFLERAWQWKEESGGSIVNQLKRLGLSADWSRERFTMDDRLSAAVRTAFVKLYEQGLIYRGKYMMNWCPASRSAISDLEVENKEVKGSLWQFRYPLADGSGAIEVATTRPETMLGDTAVAINPKDERYQDMIGKTVKLPLMEREIPIIGDEYVDSSFGTGCVKITPAHDPNDFAMGERHSLPFITVMNEDGTINENGGEFAGQDRFEARQNVVKRLEEQGYLVKVKDYVSMLPYSDRGKVPIEPLISTQWFVKIQPLAQKALDCLDQDNSPYFVPQRWRKVYRDWLVQLKDWCISRQLWWGHQIPAWYVISETGGQITDETPYIVAHSEEEAREKAMQQYGENAALQQDADALDTWFSSGLWPFSTLGWPDKTQDLETYYPNTTLVTGFDIIFFWVARMTMMGGHFTGKMPFRDVYIHGLVRDENGKKMSKSAGNGIDPLLLIQKYGSDALRYTLVREVTGAGQDISLQYNRETDESSSVEASRNFANKLWNASRFVFMNLDGKPPQQLGNPDLGNLALSDRWILSRFNQITQQTRHQIETYGLGEAAQGLYDFIWGDFCDWYIEAVKSRLNDQNNPQSRLAAQQTLGYVLEGILKLLHPFMPHVTEEIWHTLTQLPDQSLALQPYPEMDELLAKKTPQTASSQENQTIWGQIQKQLKTVSSNLNQSSFTWAAIAVVSLFAATFLFAFVSTLEQFPLLPSFLKLVGLGYTGWFAYRYLLTQPKRETLQTILNQKKVALLGSTAASSAKTLINPQLEEEFELIFGTIRTIRNLRAEAGIKPGTKVNAILQSENQQEREILSKGETYIRELAKVEELTITASLENDQQQAIAGVVGTVQVLIPLAGVVDIDMLRSKLEKNLSKVEGEVQSLRGRLNNENFVNKAPEDVVQGARDALAEAEKQQSILQQRLARLG
ncbi:MAG: valine--tRNA ligase [Cyanobacteria bacterium SW_9_44_58]|nr:MAG: valine--tRNA ligase [Cyanobacteria bacterium SW_9_44_58]